tara:strand:- start:1119 stop:1418 length:300 start_codon:yes stop_codon:yes gene_type:complete
MKKAKEIINLMLRGEALTIEEVKTISRYHAPEQILAYIDKNYNLIKTDIGVGKNKYIVYSLPITIKVRDMMLFTNDKGYFILPGGREASYKDALKWAGL